MSALYIGLFSRAQKRQKSSQNCHRKIMSALYIGLFSQQNFRYSLVYYIIYNCNIQVFGKKKWGNRRKNFSGIALFSAFFYFIVYAVRLPHFYIYNVKPEVHCIQFPYKYVPSHIVQIRILVVQEKYCAHFLSESRKGNKQLYIKKFSGKESHENILSDTGIQYSMNRSVNLNEGGIGRVEKWLRISKSTASRKNQSKTEDSFVLSVTIWNMF